MIEHLRSSLILLLGSVSAEVVAGGCVLTHGSGALHSSRFSTPRDSCDLMDNVLNRNMVLVDLGYCKQ